jgi:hypothetical protein
MMLFGAHKHFGKHASHTLLSNVLGHGPGCTPPGAPQRMLEDYVSLQMAA